ncbi:hypothetical protein QTP86_018146 [Hemibagrus guttatus]|nr:hypothetical protein QTP86_018146 [Hemibagrus guttatus]
MEKEAAQKPACSLCYPLTANKLLGCAEKQSETPSFVNISVLPPCFIMRFKRNGSYTLNRVSFYNSGLSAFIMMTIVIVT